MNGREERIHSNSQTLEPVVPLEGNRDSKVNIILVQIWSLVKGLFSRRRLEDFEGG